MIYRQFEKRDIGAIRDILESDLGYPCELQKLSCRVEEMMRRGNYRKNEVCRFAANDVMPAA